MPRKPRRDGRDRERAFFSLGKKGSDEEEAKATKGRKESRAGHFVASSGVGGTFFSRDRWR